MTEAAVLHTLDDIVAAIPSPVDTTTDRVIVGIVGAPGSGKSTIGELLVDALGPSAALLGMDGFHLPQWRLIELGRRGRMGAADTFDVDGLVRTLRRIRSSGASVSAPGFDRSTEEPVPGAITIAPEKRVVVIEGNYLLHDAGGWERVAPLLDATFFLRLGRSIRWSRLIERHIRFGKTPDAAAAWATGPDETNARLIEATARRADCVIELSL